MRHFYITSTLFLLPLVTSAKAPEDFKGLVGVIVGIIDPLIILIFALTFLALMWGIIKTWIIGGGDTEKVESGKKLIITGVIALVVMSSIWGIVQLLQSSLIGG